MPLACPLSKLLVVSFGGKGYEGLDVMEIDGCNFAEVTPIKKPSHEPAVVTAQL